MASRDKRFNNFRFNFGSVWQMKKVFEAVQNGYRGAVQKLPRVCQQPLTESISYRRAGFELNAFFFPQFSAPTEINAFFELVFINKG